MATIPLIIGGRRRREVLWEKAGAIPSWHIAPARIGNVIDLVKGEDLITFTNSNPAWGFNSAGVLVQPTANVPFIEYDPATGACLGWRIWDAVLNSIRNNTMAGAVAGTPGTLPTNWITSGTGTLTREIVAIGTINGIDYIDIRFSGTTSTGQVSIRLDSPTGIPASNGQTWTFSTWIARIGGSLTNINGLGPNANLWNSSASYVGGLDIGLGFGDISTAFIRRIGTGTIATANTAYVQPQLFIAFNSGVEIDITLRIGLPQLQQSATVGPVVKTSGLAASSTADVASITGAAFAGIWNDVESTVVCRFFSDNTAGSGRTSLLFDVGAGGAFGTTGYGVFESSAWSINPVIAPMNLSSAVAVSAGTKAIGTMAARFRANDSIIAVNGTLGTLDSACAVPASPTTLYIGRSGWMGSANYANGYIQEFAIFKSRRSNRDLILLTQ